MAEDKRNTRTSMSAVDRLAARDRTDEVAREMLAEERRRRDAKTDRLRQARLQAEHQARQN